MHTLCVFYVYTVKWHGYICIYIYIYYKVSKIRLNGSHIISENGIYLYVLYIFNGIYVYNGIYIYTIRNIYICIVCICIYICIETCKPLGLDVKSDWHAINSYQMSYPWYDLCSDNESYY